MRMYSLEELLEKELIVGCVCGCDGVNKTYYFENTFENIASFIMTHQENTDRLVFTSQSDRLILSTHGESISQCPNQELRQMVQKELNMLKQGEKEPVYMLTATEKEFNQLLYEEDQRVTAAELRML